MITLPPFKSFLASNVPSVYDNTLSYYDELTKLIAYLEQVVVPAVNETSAEVDVIKKGLADLKSYVEHYFDNLDVQEEINNKLDDMAESGQLATIIAEFLTLAPVFGYNTISDMASATNLNNGSIAKVLGNTSATDGDGAFYMIRTRTQDDNPDGVNLVAIGDTLVGVRIQDAAINALTARLDNLDKERVILIGDSYSMDRRPSTNISGWAVPLQTLMGLSDADCYTVQDNGGGFVRVGSEGTFLQGLQALNVTSKETIKKIIVCGGLNDCTSTKETILAAISDFMDYCAVNYPNATVYVGHIGNDTDTANHDGQYARFLCKTVSIPAYKQCTKYGATYLNGVEYIMKDYANYYDQSHPNQDLCNKLAYGIFEALKAGSVSVEYPVVYSIPMTYDAVTGNNFTEDSLAFTEVFTDNQDIIMNYPEWLTTLHFATARTINDPNIFLGVVEFNYVRNVFPNFSLGTCEVIAKDESDNLHYFQASLELYHYNNVSYLVLNKPATSLGNIKELGFRQFTLTIPGSIC